MEGKYGENKKKIVFFDTDERHKELKIILDRYGLTQSKLFRYLVTCMLEENQISKDIIRMIDDNSNKKSRKRSKRVQAIEEKAQQKQEEIDDIFDLIAREHPDL